MVRVVPGVALPCNRLVLVVLKPTLCAASLRLPRFLSLATYYCSGAVLARLASFTLVRYLVKLRLYTLALWEKGSQVCADAVLVLVVMMLTTVRRGAQ